MLEKQIITNKKVILFTEDEFIYHSFGVTAFTAMIVADSLDDNIKKVMSKLLTMPCKYIITYGSMANELHDIIDDRIEIGSFDNESLLNIVSDSHKDETIEDTYEFMIKHTYFDNEPYNYIIIADSANYKNFKKVIFS